jgi:hypothetical protein
VETSNTMCVRERWTCEDGMLLSQVCHTLRDNTYQGIVVVCSARNEKSQHCAAQQKQQGRYLSHGLCGCGPCTNSSLTAQHYGDFLYLASGCP